jgi:hypothetical protein
MAKFDIQVRLKGSPNVNSWEFRIEEIDPGTVNELCRVLSEHKTVRNVGVTRLESGKKVTKMPYGYIKGNVVTDTEN